MCIDCKSHLGYGVITFNGGTLSDGEGHSMLYTKQNRIFELGDRGAEAGSRTRTVDLLESVS